MPYVDPVVRETLDKGVRGPHTVGELNYLITRQVRDFLHKSGPLRYTHLNEVIGVLECVKQEVYRRLAAPYEDAMIDVNGDVF